MSATIEVAHTAGPASDNPIARSLLDLRNDDDLHAVNIVLLDFSPNAIFAGVKTALEAGRLLATLFDRRVNLVLLQPTGLVGVERAVFIADRVSWLETHVGGVRWSVACDGDLNTLRFGADDIWLATHWMTAHALHLAARAGVIDTARVVYLVQDYEPDLFATASERPAAESTYSAGFTLVVNSRQVAAHLSARGHGPVDPAHVFAPQFDSKQLMVTAAARTTRHHPTLFFYGRPSKPRNMFELGVDALRVAASEFVRRGIDVEIIMAGEGGRSLDLGNGYTVKNLGLLDRAAYFDMIARVDVGLTLQATPHPSHLPFDLAISGATAVTNDLDGARNSMHPRIIATVATPDALSWALVSAAESALAWSGRRPAIGYLPLRTGSLGGTLRSALVSALTSAGQLP